MEKLKFYKISFFLFVVTFFSIVLSALGFAATLNVDTNDAGCNDVVGTPYCTIQAAVTAAVENDTIEIASGLYSENVTSTDKGLILQGEDVDTTIVDGSGLASVIRFSSAADRNVELHDLTIRNGDNVVGGGVYHDTGTLTISGCDIISNEATAVAGGIYFNSGTLIISDSQINNNEAVGSTAGAIYFTSGSFTLTNSTVNENEATSFAAIYHGSGALTITDSEIDDNSASSSFAGIYHGAGTMVMSNSSVSGNQADDFAGVYQGPDPLTITDSTLNYNQTNTGGSFAGLYHHSNSLEMTRSSMSYNESDNGFSGLYHGAGALTVNECYVDFNETHSGSFSGLYQAIGTAIISNSSINDNEATDLVGYFQTGGSLTVTHSSFNNNEATTGSYAGFYKGGDATTVTSSSISGNQVVGSLSGILQPSGTLDIVESTISHNTAEIDIAGLYSGAVLTMTNSTVSGNQTYRHYAGVLASGNTTMSNVTLVHNVVDSETDGTGDYAGITNTGVTVTVRNSIVALNEDLGGETADCFGTITSDGYNILSDDTGCTFISAAGDQIGTAGSVIDPLINPLADNGGSTQTHALQLGSPALDAGNPAGCVDTLAVLLTTDQRGFERHVDGDDDGVAVCDIGAYEVGSCGDGYLDEGEACDDGNGVDTDACTNLCLAAVCGDGSIQDTVEECDDGNTTDGDDCSSVCEVEPEEVTPEVTPEEEPVVTETPEGTTGDGGTDDDAQVDTDSDTGSGDQAEQGGGCSLTPSQANPLNVLIFMLLFMAPVLIFPLMKKEARK